MRASIFIVSIFFLLSCSKDKFTDIPQLEYKSLDRNQWVGTIINGQVPPHIILEVTDGNGDLGFIPGKDTSFVFVKNIVTGATDSIRFPNLEAAAKKNFKAEIEVSLFNVMRRSSSTVRPLFDTFYYEVYIKDFARNKSNVVVTTDPFYLITP